MTSDESRRHDWGAAGDARVQPGTLGRYVIKERFGAGAMGVVYAAHDPELDRNVALKVLHQPHQGNDERAVRLERRLAIEARAAAGLCHPNVVTVHDVGTHAGQVFVAMELLQGGTLRAWLREQPRSIDEIVRLFVQVGRGLQAAHARGFVHRDFKPENVLLDASGVPKIVDFGLAQVAGGPNGGQPLPENEGASGGRAGVVGTPAYMAPEQFLGEAVDARADQFAFCVALYEALYGERPFAGTSLVALAAAAVKGIVRPPTRNARVPSWLRSAVLRGLAPDPVSRHRSMGALVAVLAHDRRARLKRAGAIALAVTAALAVLAVPVTYVGVSRRALHRAVERQIQDARAQQREARLRREELRSVRSRALGFYDAGKHERAEPLWGKARELEQQVALLFAEASQAAEGALNLDEGRPASQALMADLLLERSLLDLKDDGTVDGELARRLPIYDRGGERLARLRSPGHLDVETATDALDAHADIERFVRGSAEGEGAAAGHYEVVRRELPVPIRGLDLEPGSYRVTITAARKVQTRVPVLMRTGSREAVTLDLLDESEVPADFVPIAGGELLAGSDAPDEFRRDLLHNVPLHRVRGGAFLIKRHETTFAEWIQFLEALPPPERTRRTPKAAAMGFQGHVELIRLAAGRWRLQLQPSTRSLVAESGEPLRHDNRRGFEAQDWSRLPVSGIAADDVASYAAWLHRTGRVPGARLCTDREWEHAARGADGRPYPHGWSMAPADANHAATWNSDARLYGPVIVGSFPRSESPYGLHDMAGNVWEWIQPPASERGQVARGGGFAFDLMALRTDVREPVEAGMRNLTAGARLCADYPRHKEGGT